MINKSLFALIAATVFATSASAATVPSEIKVGTLYASSGAFAAISMPVYTGLKFWVDQKNAEGGVFVKPYNKKVQIKLVSYDLNYKTDIGLNLKQYKKAWLEKNADSMDQLALRKAMSQQSGKLNTLDDPVEIDETGAQIGAITPLAQIVPDDKGGTKFVVLYPKNVATGKIVYPAK